MNYAAVNLQFRGFDAGGAGVPQGDRDPPERLRRAPRARARAARRAPTTRTSTRTSRRRAPSSPRPRQIAPDRPETYYNEAILTQEYKAKSGKGPTSGEAELLNAKKLFDDFIAKAGGATEFADAVKRSKDRHERDRSDHRVQQAVREGSQGVRGRRSSRRPPRPRRRARRAPGEGGEKKEEKPQPCRRAATRRTTSRTRRSPRVPLAGWPSPSSQAACRLGRGARRRPRRVQTWPSGNLGSFSRSGRAS